MVEIERRRERGREIDEETERGRYFTLNKSRFLIGISDGWHISGSIEFVMRALTGQGITPAALPSRFINERCDSSGLNTVFSITKETELTLE